MSSRDNQTVLWSDKEFIKALEKIKAQRFVNGLPVNNLGQLTKEIVQCPSFNRVVKELIKNQNNIGLGIKVDKKRL